MFSLGVHEDVWVFVGVWIKCVSLWVAISEWVSSVCLSSLFFLRWLFFSIKNECLPFCSLSLFPASAPTPSLFHYYPLYILSIFFKLSLYITLRTHACTHTVTLSSLLAPRSSLLPSHSLRPSLSLSEHISSKALHTGNTHPDLINCC